LLLAVLFGALWLALAIEPLYRSDWLLENALVGAFILALALSWRWFTFSRISATLIFLFLCLHEVGAHYTYSEVPYDDWFRSLYGTSLNEAMGWERNHFDRAIHFS
jgi:putative membrane protein